MLKLWPITSNPPRLVFLKKAFMELPTSSRKTPHCRSCKTPMRGHRRDEGAVICPTYPTPPSTPPSERASTEPLSRSSTPDISQFNDRPEFYPVQRIAAKPSFVIPETGIFRRMNPNFVQHTRADFMEGVPDPSTVARGPSTICSSSNYARQIQRGMSSEPPSRPPSPDRECTPGPSGTKASTLDGAPSPPSQNPDIAKHGKFIAGIYDIVESNLNEARELATRIGLHSITVEKPKKFQLHSPRGKGKADEQRSVWVVTGTLPHHVEDVVAMLHEQQKGCQRHHEQLKQQPQELEVVQKVEVVQKLEVMQKPSLLDHLCGSKSQTIQIILVVVACQLIFKCVLNL
ncbi:hypothetical protein B0H34DRAFT_248453 [Crassisporium funariophilum]|nr:hypothetical protein B0H34DRAFT_248453 [Crassisporium funariophilum]